MRRTLTALALALTLALTAVACCAPPPHKAHPPRGGILITEDLGLT